MVGYIHVVASSPGHSQLFNVTLKGLGETGDEAIHVVL